MTVIALDDLLKRVDVAVSDELYDFVVFQNRLPMSDGLCRPSSIYTLARKKGSRNYTAVKSFYRAQA
jgi:hypothetical protein